MSAGPVEASQVGAVFSADRRYRYWLGRKVGEGQASVNFIGLNPSTADETVDDPTVRRCLGFARAWGCGRLVMTNLFAWRATDPKELRAAGVAPVGEETDAWLVAAARQSNLVVACWGAHGGLWERGAQVARLLEEAGVELLAFALTKSGQPGHPLYLPAAAIVRPLRELTGATLNSVSRESALA